MDVSTGGLSLRTRRLGVLVLGLGAVAVFVLWSSWSGEGAAKLDADLHSERHQDASAERLPVARASREQGHAVVLKGRPAGQLRSSVRVDVLPPDDGEYLLEVQRWSDRANGWRDGHPDGSSATSFTTETEAKGYAQVDGLAPGNYRIVEVLSATVVGQFEVAQVASSKRVRIDLSGFGYASGRVVGPHGAPAFGTLLSVLDAVHAYTHGGVGESCCVSESGTFRLRVRGDSPTFVEVTHPLLRPEGGRNPLRVNGPGSGIVLRLEEGPTATVRTSVQVQPSDQTCGVSTMLIKLYADDVNESPLYELRGVLTPDGISFGGFAPGTYTMWLDTSPFAASVRRGVLLEAGHTDLGTLAVSRGERVELHIKAGRQPNGGDVSVIATFQGLPLHRRYFRLRMTDEEDVLTGFVPGRWSLLISASGVRQRMRKDVLIRPGDVAVVEVRLPIEPN